MVNRVLVSGEREDFYVILIQIESGATYNLGLRRSDRPRENHGENTVRRLKRLQNVPDFTGLFLRLSRVESAPSNLKMETIP